MDGGSKKVIVVNLKPVCVCGHNTDSHPLIGGSNRRFSCGRVACDCRKWRPVQSMNIHKGKKA